MNVIEVLDPASYRTVAWKNGGGVTTVIAQDGEGWQRGGIVWHFGRTPIVADGPFSDLSGYERLQVVVKGNGLVLITPTGEIDLRETFRPQRYDGGTPITTRLENGPVEVVNFMADRSTHRIDLRVVPAGDRLDCPAGLHIIYAAAGPAEVACGDEVRELRNEQAVRLSLDTELAIEVISGRVAVASIYPRGS